MTTIQKIDDLLRTPITWKKIQARPQWTCEVDGEPCELQMNNFPEESLYTVKWRGQALELDDQPGCWVIPHG